MIGPRWRVASGALLGPIAGIAFALYWAAMAGGDRGRALAAYAVGVAPLAAVAGAVVGGWSVRDARQGWASAGVCAVVGIVASLVAAVVQAGIRFRIGGATGALAPASLSYAQEVLMLGGLAPAIFAASWTAGRQRGRGSGVLVAIAMGTAISALAGPTLLLGALVPSIHPLLLALIIAIAASLVARRST